MDAPHGMFRKKDQQDSPTAFKMCNDAVNVKGIQPYVKTSIQNYEKDFHSPISVVVQGHVRFTRRIGITLHVLKRSLYFHFTANVSKLFNVVIYREYNLV